MLGANHLTLQSIRLKGPKEWVPNHSGFLFVLPSEGSGKYVGGSITQSLARGDVHVSSGSAKGSAFENRTGWTAGAGVEIAINGPWTAKVEYLYAMFPNGTYNVPTPVATTGSVKFQENIVRGGVNFKFML